jgi:spermidine synthase
MEMLLDGNGAASADAAPARRESLIERIMPPLFFASGFAALCYQIAWQRALFGWFGVDLDSVSVIVSVFMLGLGGGALIGGWLADRFAGHRILVFALVEATIGLFGVFSLDVIDASGLLFAEQPLPVMIAATFVVLMAPTFAMGATLPVLVTELTMRIGNVGDSTGRLYYINTLGAAVGALAAAYALIPLFGLDGLTWIAAAMNFTIAIVGAVYVRRELVRLGAR